MGHRRYGAAVTHDKGGRGAPARARYLALLEDEPEGYPIAMNADGTQGLVFAPVASWGWAAFFANTEAGGGLPPLVFVRFARQSHGRDWADAPIELRQLRYQAESGEAFASGALRLIPFRRMEAAVNRAVHDAVLRELVPAAVLPYDVPGQDDSVPGPDGQRVTPSRWLVRRRLPAPEVPDLKLAVPKGGRRPDDFYAAVADRFLWLASTSSRAAEELAEANKVPVTTVHRWVREAKTRGVLRLPTSRQTQP